MHAHWDELGKSLLFTFPYIPHSEAPNSCKWAPDLDIEYLGINYRKAEAAWKTEITKAITHFSKTGDPHSSSPEAQYFLGIRAAVIESFMLQLGSKSNDPIRTLFLLPPDMQAHEALLWLFTEWWDCHGPRQATTMRIIDDFYKL